jgi:hypothetical protein
MGNWAKKIEKHVGDDLQPGERLLQGAFVQPLGTSKQMMARSLGGIAGAAIAAKMRGKQGPDAGPGIGDEFPSTPLVLGITDQRLIAWGHSTMLGRPKGLVLAVPVTQVAGVEADKGKASYKITTWFTDGSAVGYEAQRIGNDLDDFLAAFPAE